MKQGDILLAALPQADGGLKNRPVLFLHIMPPFQDFLVCGLSTQLHYKVKEMDEVIALADEDFPSSKLKAPSLI
jgi:mRNA interferase MazF